MSIVDATLKFLSDNPTVGAVLLFYFLSLIFLLVWDGRTWFRRVIVVFFSRKDTKCPFNRRQGDPGYEHQEFLINQSHHWWKRQHQGDSDYAAEVRHSGDSVPTVPYQGRDRRVTLPKGDSDAN